MNKITAWFILGLLVNGVCLALILATLRFNVTIFYTLCVISIVGLSAFMLQEGWV